MTKKIFWFLKMKWHVSKESAGWLSLLAGMAAGALAGFLLTEIAAANNIALIFLGMVGGYFLAAWELLNIQ